MQSLELTKVEKASISVANDLVVLWTREHSAIKLDNSSVKALTRPSLDTTVSMMEVSLPCMLDSLKVELRESDSRNPTTGLFILAKYFKFEVMCIKGDSNQNKARYKADKSMRSTDLPIIKFKDSLFA